jgi:hypothetical protein
MNIPFDQPPFSALPISLRSWLTEVCERAAADPEHKFWRDVLPSGSSSDHVVIASRCILTLFPERVKAQRCTPVDVEFVM